MGIMVSTGRYDNLLRRQQADLAVFASDEAIDISPEIDYECIQGLSNEIKERLKKIRPANIVSPRPFSTLGLATRVLIATYTGCCQEDGGYDTHWDRCIAYLRKESEAQ